MSGRMVGARLRAPLVVDVELEREAGRDLALFDDALVNDEVAELFDGVFDAKAQAPGATHADAPSRPPRLAIEGSLIEDQRPARAFLKRKGLAAVMNDRGDDALASFS